MTTGSLSLDIVDASGAGIGDNVRIELASLESSARYRNTVMVEKTVQLGGIECAPFARYLVTVWPSVYRISQFFLTLAAGKVTTREPLFVPVDPDKVMGIDAPAYGKLSKVVQAILDKSAIPDLFPGKQGKVLYDLLDAPRKACLLNICAKASHTGLESGQNCLDLIGGLVRLRGDRFFALATAALREEVQNARATFVPVSGALHHPPEGYAPAGSFKTRDRHANLQLSFFRKGTAGDDYLVDADIDEAAGIEHTFEVAGNALTGHTTNPYDIREVLIRDQSIDPGYKFLFGQEAKVLTAGPKRRAGSRR